MSEATYIGRCSMCGMEKGDICQINDYATVEDKNATARLFVCRRCLMRGVKAIDSYRAWLKKEKGAKV